MDCKILWLTGLSGSGKTTLAKFLKKKLLELKFKVNNTNFKGIGRISRTENYLISEFNEKNISYSQFSLQVQPLERDLFLGFCLVI